MLGLDRLYAEFGKRQEGLRVRDVVYDVVDEEGPGNVVG